jgi:hypothetical protein
VDPFTKHPFPNNIIPTSALDAAGVKLANALWPAPNGPGRTPSRLDNFTTSAVQASNEDQGVARLDHTLSKVWKFSGSYGHQFLDLGGWDPFGNRTTPIDPGRAEKDHFQNVVASLTAVFSPRLLGEFRSSFSRIEANRIPMSIGFNLTTLGFPQYVEDAVQVHSFPDIGISGFSSLVSSTSSRQIRISNTYSENGSITLIRGAQTLKFGAEYRTLGWNEWSNNDAAGQYSFTGRFSGQDGFGVADMVMGYPFSGFITQSQHLSLLRKYVSLYVQNDWKVTQRLTLNLGMQWSIDALSALSITRDDAHITWLAMLPSICEELRRAGEAGCALGRWLAVSHWDWIETELRDAEGDQSPSAASAKLNALVPPLLAILRSTVIVDASDLRESISQQLAAAQMERDTIDRPHLADDALPVVGGVASPQSNRYVTARAEPAPLHPPVR